MQYIGRGLSSLRFSIRQERLNREVLRDDLIRSGNWFFKYRSYLPLVLLPFVAIEVYRKRTALAGLPVLDRWWGVGCLVVAFIGMLIRFHTTGHAAKGTSGRNTRSQKADFLNTTGMYSITRNPLYLGNLIITLAIVAATRSAELVIAVTLIFVLYYERIVSAEEAYLEDKFGEVYRSWASKTPWLLPNLRLWVPAELPFSWRRAIRSEYNSLFGVTSALFIVEHGRTLSWADLKDVIWAGRPVLDPFWSAVFVVGALVYVVCRSLKKRTRLLR